MENLGYFLIGLAFLAAIISGFYLIFASSLTIAIKVFLSSIAFILVSKIIA